MIIQIPTTQSRIGTPWYLAILNAHYLEIETRLGVKFDCITVYEPGLSMVCLLQFEDGFQVCLEESVPQNNLVHVVIDQHTKDPLSLMDRLIEVFGVPVLKVQWIDPKAVSMAKGKPQ